VASIPERGVSSRMRLRRLSKCVFLQCFDPPTDHYHWRKATKSLKSSERSWMRTLSFLRLRKTSRFSFPMSLKDTNQIMRHGHCGAISIDSLRTRSLRNKEQQREPPSISTYASLLQTLQRPCPSCRTWKASRILEE